MGACTAGSFRCNHGTLERCEDGKFQPYLVCATPELCEPALGECLPPVCMAGSYECFDNALAECADGRHEWETSVQICDPNQCVAYFDRTDIANACVPP
jgi:hypothetical protein